MRALDPEILKIPSVVMPEGERKMRFATQGLRFPCTPPPPHPPTLGEEVVDRVLHHCWDHGRGGAEEGLAFSARGQRSGLLQLNCRHVQRVQAASIPEELQWGLPVVHIERGVAVGVDKD